jgi:curved DNA-binding protein CbpA
MKTIYFKNILLMISFLFSFQIFGNEWDKMNIEKVDRFGIIRERYDKWKLKKPLLIFNNFQLSGSPSFKIDNEKIYDLRGSKEALMPKVDFLDYVNEVHGIDFKISNYKNGIAELFDHEKKYYLKFSRKSFLPEAFPRVSWRRLRAQEALELYEITLKNDKAL